jgi:hypothetical protein
MVIEICDKSAYHEFGKCGLCGKALTPDELRRGMVMCDACRAKENFEDLDSLG